MKERGPGTINARWRYPSAWRVPISPKPPVLIVPGPTRVRVTARSLRGDFAVGARPGQGENAGDWPPRATPIVVAVQYADVVSFAVAERREKWRKFRLPTASTSTPLRDGGARTLTRLPQPARRRRLPH
jgi:hypothetical protein